MILQFYTQVLTLLAKYQWLIGSYQKSVTGLKSIIICLCYKDKLHDYGYSTMTSLEDQSVSNVDIILDKTKLKRVDKTKFLGVTIDGNLSWKNQIISRNIGMINKLKFIIPERIPHTLYCTLVLPYITYGILIWGKACKTYLEKIHKLPKWAVRIYISNSHYRSHSAPL